jgi:5'-methylthioadenosine phosphorylase
MILGIIGGSGIYDIEGLERPRWERVESGFGSPSDELLTGELDGLRLVFLPRHGRGHRLLPSEINFRANIDALKRAGVTDLLSFSAVGSLREDIPPGTFVIVDQFIDRTVRRLGTFFGDGVVAHVAMGNPVCARMGDAAESAAREAGIPVRRGGSCVVIEGPQFSTRAESAIYRQWGGTVIGMTNLPEAKLAREAELCYCSVTMVTDFDVWHPEHDAVTVDMVMAVMRTNVGLARELIRRVAPKLGERPVPCRQGCDRSLEHAILTPKSSLSEATRARLLGVAGRVL